MSFTNKEIEDILRRLKSLEQNDAAMSECIQHYHSEQRQQEGKMVILMDDNVEFRREISNCKKENSTLKWKIGALNKKVEAMKNQQIPALQKRNKDLETEIQRLKRENSTSTAETQNVDKQNKKTEDLDLENIISILVKKKDEQEAKIQGVKKELSTLTTMTEKIEAFDRKVLAMTNQQDVQKNEIQGVKKELSNLKTKTQKIEAFDRKVLAMTNQQDELKNEIQGVKKELSNLKTKTQGFKQTVDAVKRKNEILGNQQNLLRGSTKMEIQTLWMKVSTHTEDGALDRKIEALIKKGIAGLEQKTDDLKIELLTFVSTSQSTTKALDKKVERVKNHLIPFLEKAVEKCESQNQSLKSETSKLMEKIRNMETNVTHLSRLHRVLNRALVEKHNEVSLNEKVDDLKGRTDDIENRIGLVSQSITKAKLKPSEVPTVGQFVKLDKRVWVSGSGGMIDQSSCVVPNCDGEYVVGVRFVQRGKGEVRLYLKQDEMCGEYCLGKTSSANELCCVSEVMKWRKGKRVWLEAKQVEGKACIGWCYIYCWLACEL